MAAYDIHFNQACFGGRELAYIADAIGNRHIAGNGAFTRKCQELLQKELGVPKAFLTTSCTHALEMAALLLDVRPGDEIIVPSFTFVSTANAFVLRGARPVFCDIRPDTLNLDEKQLEGLITRARRPSCRCITPELAAKWTRSWRSRGGTASRWWRTTRTACSANTRARWLGTFGRLATQSFHETKNVICGEGGALLINDERLIERAEIIREKGTDRSRFFRGQVDKYTWVDIGSSYAMSDLLAAFLFGQLEQCPTIQDRRRAIWKRYDAGLRGLVRDPRRPPAVGAIMLRAAVPHVLSAAAFPGKAEALITHLRERGIQSVFHYLPLHLSAMGRQFGGQTGLCPVTEDVSDRLLRLPFYNSLSADDQGKIVRAVQEFQV